MNTVDAGPNFPRNGGCDHHLYRASLQGQPMHFRFYCLFLLTQPFRLAARAKEVSCRKCAHRGGSGTSCKPMWKTAFPNHSRKATSSAGPVVALSDVPSESKRAYTVVAKRRCASCLNGPVATAACSELLDVGFHLKGAAASVGRMQAASPGLRPRDRLLAGRISSPRFRRLHRTTSVPAETMFHMGRHRTGRFISISSPGR